MEDNNVNNIIQNDENEISPQLIKDLDQAISRVDQTDGGGGGGGGSTSSSGNQTSSDNSSSNENQVSSGNTSQVSSNTDLKPILLILSDGETPDPTPDDDEEPVLLEEDNEIKYKLQKYDELTLTYSPPFESRGTTSIVSKDFLIGINDNQTNDLVSLEKSEIVISYDNDSPWCNVSLKKASDSAVKSVFSQVGDIDNLDKIWVPDLSVEKNTGESRTTTITFKIKNSTAIINLKVLQEADSSEINNDILISKPIFETTFTRKDDTLVGSNYLFEYYVTTDKSNDSISIESRNLRALNIDPNLGLYNTKISNVLFYIAYDDEISDDSNKINENKKYFGKFKDIYNSYGLQSDKSNTINFINDTNSSDYILVPINPVDFEKNSTLKYKPIITGNQLYIYYTLGPIKVSGTVLLYKMATIKLDNINSCIYSITKENNNDDILNENLTPCFVELTNNSSYQILQTDGSHLNISYNGYIYKTDNSNCIGTPLLFALKDSNNNITGYLTNKNKAYYLNKMSISAGHNYKLNIDENNVINNNTAQVMQISIPSDFSYSDTLIFSNLNYNAIFGNIPCTLYYGTTAKDSTLKFRLYTNSAVSLYIYGSGQTHDQYIYSISSDTAIIYFGMEKRDGSISDTLGTDLSLYNSKFSCVSQNNEDVSDISIKLGRNINQTEDNKAYIFLITYTSTLKRTVQINYENKKFFTIHMYSKNG